MANPRNYREEYRLRNERALAKYGKTYGKLRREKERGNVSSGALPRPPLSDQYISRYLGLSQADVNYIIKLGKTYDVFNITKIKTWPSYKPYLTASQQQQAKISFTICRAMEYLSREKTSNPEQLENYIQISLKIFNRIKVHKDIHIDHASRRQYLLFTIMGLIRKNSQTTFKKTNIFHRVFAPYKNINKNLDQMGFYLLDDEGGNYKDSDSPKANDD